MFISNLRAFIKKNFLINISYRLSFILNLAGVIASVLTFYLITKMFGQGINPYLKEYKGGYFPYVLIGLAFYNYLSLSLRAFSVSLREEQLTGTLEAIFLTPVKVSTLIICLPCWDFIFNSLNAFFCLLFGIYFLGVKLVSPNFFAVLIIIVLTVISSISIGIISGAFIMIFKRGDPIIWLVNLVSGIFGGVYFPAVLLPKKLHFVSNLLPITYSLEALRSALLKGYGVKELLPGIFILIAFCVVLLPASILIFKFAVRMTKATGSLAHY
ncbi:MAG: ABC transporter permease [Candidatus Omnitrophota bacterium]